LKTVAGNLSDRRLRKSIIRILRDSELCSIATLDPRNRPHINTAYFSYRGLDDLEIFFLSDTKSRHCRNLSRNPFMAMTIFRTNQPWDAPGRGLQLFGTCSQREGPSAREAERAYANRFPSYAKWMSSTKKDEKKLVEQLRSYRFYRFLPQQLKVFDEAEYGGATFVMVTIKRRNPASKTRKGSPIGRPILGCRSRHS